MVRNRVYIFILLTGALIGVLFVLWHYNREVTNVQVAETTGSLVRFGELVIPVTIADTDAERAQGLSGTLTLAPTEGKLFVFDTPGIYSFWMKDMHYSIDIIWLDEVGKVIYIAPSVAPETYPEVFAPSAPARYVLEVNAGFSTAQGIDVGSLLSIEI